VIRSIAVKLTLAFLLVALTGAILVVVVLRQRTQTAFGQFILNREQRSLVDYMSRYYQANGSWQGVAENYSTFVGTSPYPFPAGGSPSSGRMPFTLVGPNRVIIIGETSNRIGQVVSDHDLQRGVPLEAQGRTVGWLLLGSRGTRPPPNSPEEIFFRDVNRAALLSALVAAGLALLLGGFLALTMTRSLRELTEATVEIARGELGGQVKVRSSDELGELAASFNKMSRDLARATHARKQMTADIAHDLRSPLSVISGYAEALSDGKLPGTPEIYSVLYQETQHLSLLVDDLRTLSLADAGELPFYPQVVAPRALLERAAASHALAAEQKGVAIQIEAEEPLPSLSLDPERMAQVFDNLIGNAFRYAPAGGQVFLAARGGARTVQFQVRDNGSGIAPEDLPRIFDRFYRGDKSRQQNGESGLGLAIAKSIVEAQGGTIEAQSLPGQGSTFTVTFKI
jgi:two-component system sensor histidine kinase BaeS